MMFILDNFHQNMVLFFTSWYSILLNDFLVSIQMAIWFLNLPYVKMIFPASCPCKDRAANTMLWYVQEKFRICQVYLHFRYVSKMFLKCQFWLNRYQDICLSFIEALNSWVPVLGFQLRCIWLLCRETGCAGSIHIAKPSAKLNGQVLHLQWLPDIASLHRHRWLDYF